MITRDGDHFIIGNERIPARTECAGRMLEWEDDETLLVTGTDGFVLVVGVEHIGWEVSIGHEFLSRTEPTVRDAQRRVLKVLAALLEPLGEE